MVAASTATKNALCSVKQSKDHLRHIERNNTLISDRLRETWSLQAAQAIASVHEQDTVHQDFDMKNLLVHYNGKSFDILLDNFGGALCKALNLDGNNLPDDPFSDPTLADDDGTPRRDVFSLGIVIYFIMTGHYLFHEGPFPGGAARWVFGELVNCQFQKGRLPGLTNMHFGQVIKRCCYTRDYPSGSKYSQP